MVQSADSRQGDYLSDLRSAQCCFPSSRSLLAYAEMCAIVLVIVLVFGHEAFHMAFVEYDDKI